MANQGSKLPVGAMVVALALAGASGCTNGGSSSAPPPPPMTATTVQSQLPGQPAGFANEVTIRATVKAVDLGSRTVTLVGPQGQAIKLKVGEQVRNLPQVKPGDGVVVRFLESVAFAIEPPGRHTPEDLLAIAAGRAAPGQLPGGGVASTIVVSGLVVGVSPATNTIWLAGPDGDNVREIYVQNPENQRLLPTLKPGDTITAAITEGIAVSVEPAP
jgi:hypothetical protein